MQVTVLISALGLCMLFVMAVCHFHGIFFLLFKKQRFFFGSGEVALTNYKNHVSHHGKSFVFPFSNILTFKKDIKTSIKKRTENPYFWQVLCSLS